MRPGAKRRDHRRRASERSAPRAPCFNEARREAPGSPAAGFPAQAAAYRELQ